MIQTVKRFLEENNLTSKEKILLTGFSGGSDSLCLLDILKRLSKEYKFKIIALHLNHNWRGEEAKNEEMNCKDYCEKNGIKFISETLREDVKKTETSAREERHKFFKKYYEKYNADGLFLAHTKSDNTETIIYRIAKGTGVKGLGGICPANEINAMKIYRPLLSFSRKEIENYIKAQNLTPNNDSSNENTKYKRNYIRKKILPLIKEINPNFEDACSNLSKIALSQEKIIKEYLELLKKDLCCGNKFNTQKFIFLSEDVQKKFILEFLIEKNLDYDLKKICEVYEFIKASSLAKTGKTLSITSDLWLFVSSKEFYFIKEKKKCDDEILIESEGEYLLNGKRFIIEKYSGDKVKTYPKETENYAFTGTLSFPLTLRFRKEGDIICPFGMKGSMKLKKFFINKNIPKNVRDSVILLCKENEVLWACGCALNEKLKAAQIPEYIIRTED